jgi:hypothetical protein
VGSLQAIGGSIITLIVGKYVNVHGKKLIAFIAGELLLISVARMLVSQPLSAYIITIIAALCMNMFSVSYFSTINKTVKDDNEEEFMVVREIPVVLGRMVVFGVIYLTLPFLHYFFLLPIVVISLLLILYFSKGRHLAS